MSEDNDNKENDGKMNIFNKINEFMGKSFGIFWHVLLNIISGFVVSLFFILSTYLINLITKSLGFIEQDLDHTFTSISKIASIILISLFMLYGLAIFFIKSIKDISTKINELKPYSYFNGDPDALPNKMSNVIKNSIKEVSKSDKIMPVEDEEENDDGENDEN